MPTGSVRYATAAFIDIDARTSCRLRTPQEPPESGTIRADLHVVNGSLKVLYYERAAAGADRRVLLSPGISFTPEVNGAQIPDVEAVARTAADRARLTRLCAGHPERIRTKPECGTR